MASTFFWFPLLLLKVVLSCHLFGDHVFLPPAAFKNLFREVFITIHHIGVSFFIYFALFSHPASQPAWASSVRWGVCHQYCKVSVSEHHPHHSLGSLSQITKPILCLAYKLTSLPGFQWYIVYFTTLPICKRFFC